MRKILITFLLAASVASAKTLPERVIQDWITLTSLQIAEAPTDPTLTGITSWWKFDNSYSDFYSVNNVTNMFTGAATTFFTNGVKGVDLTAMYNPTGAVCSVLTNINLSTNDFTFTMWVKPVVTNVTGKYIMSLQTPGTFGLIWAIDNGQSYLLAGYPPGTWMALSKKGNVLAGAWTFLAIQRQGTSFFQWVNTNKYTAATGQTGAVHYYGKSLSIGGLLGAAADKFAGTYDNVRFYQGTAVTSNNMVQIYNDEKP